LPRSVVLEFRRYYFEALADTGLTRPDTDPALGLAGATVDRAALRSRLFGTIVPGARFAEFCVQPALRDWYAWFLGGEPFLHRRKILRHVAPAEGSVGTATQAHYDLVYIREGTDAVLTSWIPLGDCPVEQGGLIYLENSHRRVREDELRGRLRRPASSITADLPKLAEDYDSRWLVAEYRAGDMVVHTAHTVHAALDNRDPDNRIRLSTDIRYQLATNDTDPRWQREWHDRDGL
jgi:Phytanoyl-CoA dioxygenase (PhyH)